MKTLLHPIVTPPRESAADSNPLNDSEISEDQLDRLQLLQELAKDFSGDSTDLFQNAAANIASTELFGAFLRFDGYALSKRLKEKPELYFQLINSSCQFSRAKLERDKFESRKQQAEAKQRVREQKLRDRKPILLTSHVVASATSALASNTAPSPSSTPADRQPGSCEELLVGAAA